VEHVPTRQKFHHAAVLQLLQAYVADLLVF
jgi:hypothetical protein